MRPAHSFSFSASSLASPVFRAAVALALASSAATAHAQTTPTDAKNIAGARDLATAGMQLQSEQRYAECAAKFDAAHRLYPEATTVTLRLAQCLKASGKLVEAGEAYRVLLTTPVAADAPPQFKQAQQQGKAESDQLQTRIPQLTITIDPSTPPSGTQLHMQHGNATGAPTIDVLDAAWIGTPRRLNPGTYTVFATAPGYASKTKEITIAEGERKSEGLVLSAGEQAPVVAGEQTKVAGPNEAPAPYAPPLVPGAEPADTAKSGLMLGGGGGVAAAGGAKDVDGAAGMAHLAAWLRLNKFLLGGVAEYQSLGRGTSSRLDAYYAGVHVGVISTRRKKVAFWFDGGLGVAGVGDAEGFGARVALGPSFPLARNIRLITKGILGVSLVDNASYAYAGLGLDLQFEIPFGKPVSQ